MNPPIPVLRACGRLLLWSSFAACLTVPAPAPAQTARSMRFQAPTPAEAQAWQQAARARLFALMMGGQPPARAALDPQRLQRLTLPEGWVLEELSLQTLPDRRAHVWLGRPARSPGRLGAVLALHGHGGTGEQIVRGTGLYWYGRALLERGYVVIAPDVGQHELQHTNWSLMGERTWDALRCLDYVATLPEVDPERLAVAGLSLGGETTMYVAALDPRVRLACSSGWLSTVANLKNGHCRCFNFPGLEESFDFADIFACLAPRALVCELGELERAPGGFPVAVGRQAWDEIRAAYRAFNAETNLAFTVHPGPHVFDGRDFWPRCRALLGGSATPAPDDAAAVAWVRFTDGPESLVGQPYYWLGRANLQVVFHVPPKPGDALELNWGSKGDERDAQVLVNGHRLALQGGGHWGFRWLRLPIPDSVQGDHYDIQLTRGLALPAFLSEIRLTAAQRDSNCPPLSEPAYQGKLTVLPGPTGTNAAFPEMRARWTREAPLPASFATGPRAALLRQAERNGRLANEALFRSRRYLDGWLAHADPITGLIPRNLTVSRDYWNGRDAAADNYPFMVLTAALTDQPLLDGRLTQMLRTETRLTCRLDRLPDDYSFSKRGWRRDKLDLNEMVFDAAEYVKDGLLPITEWLGPTAWSDRMLGITDDLWKHAAIDTPFGPIPTLNFEVCGDLLQAGARLFWLTGDRKYLDWTIRLGDYYLLGTNHPTRDLKQLRLIDHGCEVINGLTELYVAVARARPAKQAQYRAPLHELFDTILARGRNADGLLYSWFNPQTGEHSRDLCDTWGYVLDGFYTLWRVDGTEAYRDAVRLALGNLKGKYVGACWGDQTADGYADSIEGAINLLNREAVPSAAHWLDCQTRLMWALQQPDGIIEGWHGDGNFARTSLMYALWKTLGASLQPWRADLRFGAARDGASIWLTLLADEPWEGRIVFDRPRHQAYLHLPLDYPRINQFPEWFTLAPAARCDVTLDSEPAQNLTGQDLASGLPVKLEPGRMRVIQVHPR